MTRARYRVLLTGLASGVLLLFVFYWAYAHSGGITGQTLKGSPTAGCGAKLTGGGSCHGTLPTTSLNVKITGPRILALAQTGTFTFSDSGAAGSGGGFDIAVSNGSLGSTSPVAQLLNLELTHKSAITVPYTIDFSLTPSASGPDTIFANGKGTSFSTWNWAPNFIFRVGPPPAPAPDSPLASSVGVSLTPRLVWSGIAGPRWTVEIAAESTFAAPVVHHIVVGDTAYLVQAGVLLHDTMYYWHVSATDTGGTSSYFNPPRTFRTVVATDVAQTGRNAPASYGLSQNYPNPFNPSTRISFSLPAASSVRLAVYDVQGREIAVLAQGELSSGTYTTTFDAGALRVASGVYFYRLTASANGESGASARGVRSYTETRKLLVVK